MRIGELDASMLFSNSLLCGHCVRANNMPVAVTAGSEGSADDADEKDDDEKQGNGLFHDVFLLFYIFIE